MKKHEEYLLRKNGWIVECESPFEIRSDSGDVATGEAAEIVLTSLQTNEAPTQGPLKRYSPLWHDLNTLLGFLRAGQINVATLVDRYYLNEHNNPAPGELLRELIAKLQKRLDEAT